MYISLTAYHRICTAGLNGSCAWPAVLPTKAVVRRMAECCRAAWLRCLIRVGATWRVLVLVGVRQGVGWFAGVLYGPSLLEVQQRCAIWTGDLC